MARQGVRVEWTPRSIGVVGGNQPPRTIIHCEEICMNGKNVAESLESLERLEQRFDTIDERIKELDMKADVMLGMFKTMWYAPGMPGSVEAQLDFEQHTTSQNEDEKDEEAEQEDEHEVTEEHSVSQEK